MMKYSKIIYLLLLFLMLLWGTLAPAQETVRLTNGEWPPYLSKDLKYYGLASRIVSEAFALENIKVEYGFFPWPRAKALAKYGQDWEGSVVWSRTPEHEKYFYISDPVVFDKAVFFHLKDFPFHWDSIDDLKGLVIGGTISYFYGDLFETAEKEKRILVERVYKDELNFNKLLHHRIQLFVCNFEVGYSMLYKNYPPETVSLFTNNSKPVKNTALCVLFARANKANEKLVAKFNGCLAKLKKSGKYEQYCDESLRGEYVLTGHKAE